MWTVPPPIGAHLAAVGSALSTAHVPAFDGFVLAGGQSSRMGTDKAFIDVDGRTMVEIAVDALRDAGASSVRVVGGDRRRIERLNLDFIADDDPEGGPLTALRTALRRARLDRAVVLSCDLPLIDGGSIRSVLGGLHSADCSIPMVEGRPQWLAGAWRTLPTLTICDVAVARGDTAMKVMAAGLRRSFLLPSEPRRFADADHPDDLGYSSRQCRY